MRFSTLHFFVICALFWQGAVSTEAQPFSLQSAPANVARWMYPFNESPANRPNASAFAAFGNVPNFDTRDGQFLLGWNTSNSIPIGQGARNYLISYVRVTLTISSEGDQYAYDNRQHDYRTYFLSSSSNYLANTNVSAPIELYGVGFRGGFTNTSGVFVPYAATNFPQNGPFAANARGGDYTNRVAYAACYSTNGVLVDVSDNVGDNGTNEIANPFEVSPFAIGCNTNFIVGQLMPTESQITCDLNLNDPLIYGYVQQGLNQGTLRFMASSLVNADYLLGGLPNWPDFYTVFDQFISTNDFPRIDMGVTIVRTNLDSDADGLPDDWEQFYFGRLGLGAANSSDGDDISNLAKYIGGINPTNPATDFRLLSIQNQSGSPVIRFTIAPSRQYSVQWSDDLQHWSTATNPTLLYLSDWLTKSGPHQAPDAAIYAEWHDTNAPAGQRFYRVNVQ
ncbi:MAG TPA: hypothetical protein VMH87_07000 [Pseudomonadales bacterium]|nr:hypothetical protein [Pseudomonadales bacterium]